MGTSLFTNYEEVVAMLLFGIGFTTLLFNRNLLKKIIGFNFMDTGIYLFLTSMGYIEGHLAPIYVEGLSTAESYINPIPAGLVLTGIVVSVSVTAIMLSLTVRLYRRYLCRYSDHGHLRYVIELHRLISYKSSKPTYVKT